MCVLGMGGCGQRSHGMGEWGLGDSVEFGLDLRVG